MNLTPVLRSKFFNAGGTAALAGGKVYTYQAGTSTPQATYTDASGGTPNANPVILDANGEANIWFDPSLSYKVILQDSSGVQQWSVDNITGLLAGGVPQWNSTVTYSKGNLVWDGTTAGLIYVSLTNSNTNNALSSVSNWALFCGGVQRAALTTNTTLATSDHMSTVRSNSTAGALTHTLPPCSTTPIGFTVTVKDIGTGGFATTVKGSGSDQIDGAVTYGTVLIQYASATFRNNGTSYDVLNLSPLGKLPTIQKFTSGSGTYTLPTGCLYIRVRLVGGGGGGGSSGTAAWGSASGGVASTFGTSLLTANGGGAGSQSTGGTGGTATVNSPATQVIANAGVDGQGSHFNNGLTDQQPGGNGASTPLGGGGGGGAYGAAGRPATVNTGAGGGGGGGPAGSTSAFYSGSGGGAGAFIEAIITSPSATYSYAVGAKGSGGTAGTSGFAGGDGGSGYIIVEEYYK